MRIYTVIASDSEGFAYLLIATVLKDEAEKVMKDSLMDYSDIKLIESYIEF